MNEFTNTVITVITFIVTLGPLVIACIRYVGAATKNQMIITIAERAAIIVSALDRLDIDNIDKREMAIGRLIKLANEFKFPLTYEQASEYIEDAVRVMHGAQNATESTTETK